MPANEETTVDSSNAERAKLGERLRKSREYLALSQDEVSKAVGIARAAISLIESGQRRVEALELKKFAEVYQRSVSYFTGETTDYSDLPQDVEHLARAVSTLSSKDREELVRFAEFLQSRTDGGKEK
jgi:transcriptional regulator with XRE-family HTH domain